MLRALRSPILLALCGDMDVLASLSRTRCFGEARVDALSRHRHDVHLREAL